uniref:28S ribosomal protein S30, mitochondrial-like n=1 Tax=Ciona intestinalis TaxID=7719 RepID=UPI0005217D61|nr:28S ribosomal protein S30, mitochondrial-like [Ciona intestinalis]|eukprot:XP_026695098.1 28S ribosomal protein S30, mitochondrial-like [Ciona intestinalis]
MTLSRKFCARCVQWRIVLLPKPVTYIGASRISQTTCVHYPKTVREPTYPSIKTRLAQTNFKSKKLYDIPLTAQEMRKPWEYPTQVDQYAEWKHKRWYDVLYRKWVETCPKPDRDFTITRKSKRDILFQAENIRELLKLYLDRFHLKKYVIESFNFEFPAPNISYYYQYLTHTKYVHGMPFNIEHAPVDEKHLNSLREFVNDRLLLRNHELKNSEQNAFTKHTSDEKLMSETISYIVAILSSSNPQLTSCEIDLKPENSMFWLRGRGFLKWTLPEDLPVAYQCHDTPLIQIRTSEQLPEFTSRLEEMSCSGRIPTFHTTPHVFRRPLLKYRNTITPGYRPNGGDIDPNYQHALDADKLEELAPPIYNPHPYGHTQLSLLPIHYSRDWYNENMEHCDITDEIDEHLKGHGIMSGWVWTAAQAHYAGHWMDKDITQPFCSQNIVTDGQFLSFFCYQLNTIAIDPDNVDENPYRNLCYGKTDVKLYEENTENGVIEINDEALKMLIKFVSNGKSIQNNVGATEEEILEHDRKLIVQEPDIANPELEHQMPIHKVRTAELKRLAKEKREQEDYEKLPYRKKLTKMIGMS